VQPATPLYTLFAQILSVVYFAFFFAMPWYTKMDNAKCKPEPERVTG
jgi:ubiquinol-cytochrome c reductase cytochrome b subunit